MGGGCDWAALGDRLLGWNETERNRERGRKWAEQEDIDKGGGGGTGESVSVIVPPSRDVDLLIVFMMGVDESLISASDAYLVVA